MYCPAPGVCPAGGGSGWTGHSGAWTPGQIRDVTLWHLHRHQGKGGEGRAALRHRSELGLVPTSVPVEQSLRPQRETHLQGAAGRQEAEHLTRGWGLRSSGLRLATWLSAPDAATLTCLGHTIWVPGSTCTPAGHPDAGTPPPGGDGAPGRDAGRDPPGPAVHRAQGPCPGLRAHRTGLGLGVIQPPPPTAHLPAADVSGEGRGCPGRGHPREARRSGEPCSRAG